VEIRASPLNSLGLRLDPQASVELYRAAEPLTLYDRLLLAHTHPVDHWAVPALSALCRRTALLALSEARQMDIEDIVLVATVREDIREHALRIDIDATEIPRRVEAAGKLTIHEDIFIPLGG